jgi:hypothetical protein
LTYLADAILDSIKYEDLQPLILLSVVDEFDPEIADLLLEELSVAVRELNLQLPIMYWNIMANA